MIEGLSPRSACRQGELRHSPRSTVGTVTEIHDSCGCCSRVSASSIVRAAAQRRVAERAADGGSSTVASGRRHASAFARRTRAASKATSPTNSSACAADGFVRAVIDGTLVDLANVRALRPGRPHSVDVDIDRLSVKSEARSRLAESLELGLRKGNGIVRIAFEAGEELTLVGRDVCPNCGLELGDSRPPACRGTASAVRASAVVGSAGACSSMSSAGAGRQHQPARGRDRRLGLGRGALLPDDARRASAGDDDRRRQAVRQARSERARARVARRRKEGLRGCDRRARAQADRTRAAPQRRGELRLSAARAGTVHARRAL